jgi:hypothetical protein
MRELGLQEAPHGAAESAGAEFQRLSRAYPEQALAAQRLAQDVVARIEVLMNLGLGYLYSRPHHARSERELANVRADLAPRDLQITHGHRQLEASRPGAAGVDEEHTATVLHFGAV